MDNTEDRLAFLVAMGIVYLLIATVVLVSLGASVPTNPQVTNRVALFFLASAVVVGGLAVLTRDALMRRLWEGMVLLAVLLGVAVFTIVTLHAWLGG